MKRNRDAVFAVTILVVLVVALVAVLAATMGQGPKDSRLTMVTWEPTSSTTRVAINGTPRVKNACLMLDQELGIWPRGWSVKDNAILDENGKEMGRIGQPVQLLGGRAPAEFATQTTGVVIPEQCKTDTVVLLTAP